MWAFVALDKQLIIFLPILFLKHVRIFSRWCFAWISLWSCCVLLWIVRISFTTLYPWYPSSSWVFTLPWQCGRTSLSNLWKVRHSWQKILHYNQFNFWIFSIVFPFREKNGNTVLGLLSQYFLSIFMKVFFLGFHLRYW